MGYRMTLLEAHTHSNYILPFAYL